MIFGVLSAVFLAIHSLLLGLETDIKIFKFLRRVVLLSFIIFEIVAQSILVINFYKLKIKLLNLFNPNILKLKMWLVSILIFVALLSIPILIKSGNVFEKNKQFKPGFYEQSLEFLNIVKGQKPLISANINDAYRAAYLADLIIKK